MLNERQANHNAALILCPSFIEFEQTDILSEPSVSKLSGHKRKSILEKRRRRRARLEGRCRY